MSLSFFLKSNKLSDDSLTDPLIRWWWWWLSYSNRDWVPNMRPRNCVGPVVRPLESKSWNNEAREAECRPCRPEDKITGQTARSSIWSATPTMHCQTRSAILYLIRLSNGNQMQFHHIYLSCVGKSEQIQQPSEPSWLKFRLCETVGS